MLEVVIGFSPLVLAFVAGYMRPNGWTAVGATLLPVALFAVTGNLSSKNDDGYETWAIIAVPLFCAASAAICGLGMLTRLLTDRVRTNRTPERPTS